MQSKIKVFNDNFEGCLLTFALVNYVCLFQGYIRGQFVLKQQQFLIGRAASVQIPALIHPWIMGQFNLLRERVFLSTDNLQLSLHLQQLLFHQISL